MSTEHRHPAVTVAGEVRPQTVDLRDLAELGGEEVTIDFHCMRAGAVSGRATAVSRSQPCCD